MNEQHANDALPPVNQGSQQGGGATHDPTPPPANPLAAAAPVPLQDPMAPPVADPVAANLASAIPAIADDVDLIEKEWVEKAKAIVEQTKDDPYLQNEEMTKMKHDYLRKRYNRDIKSSEAS